MATAAHTLAKFATDLTFSDIPAEVAERAKACMIDTIAATAFGAGLPWSQLVTGFARRNSAPGNASVIGTNLRLRGGFAALANAALAHASELDCSFEPNVGAHPGASLTSPGLAVAEQRGNSGKELIVAFVAGSEVMYRIASAMQESIEKLGFRGSSLLDVFGGAVVAGRLMKLNVEGMTNALGIGGSLCSGLIDFSKPAGGMIKRLHLGRVAESGVTAAAFAREGLSAPASVLEGQLNFFNLHHDHHAHAERLTAGLGDVWHTMKIAHKRYACHFDAQVPVTAALELKVRHGVSGSDIAAIIVATNEKIVRDRNILEPEDLVMAQDSVPFCVALTFYRDPRDPSVFSDASLADPAIRRLCRKVKLEVLSEIPEGSSKTSRVIVRLNDGQERVRELQCCPGMPGQPLSSEELRGKFDLLTAALPPVSADRIFTRFLALESVSDMRSFLND